MSILTDAMWEYLGAETSVGQENIYPWRLPKDAVLPALTFQFIPSSGPVKVHDDAHDTGTVQTLFDRRRMQWDAWAHSYREIEALGQELKHLLQGFHGTMGTTTPIEIGSIHIDIELDSYDEDIRVYRRILDGMVRYNDIFIAAAS